MALATAAVALWGCGQYNQAGSDQDVHRESSQQLNSQKVEKRAERASREIARGATALVEGVKKGVKEGVQQGRRDVHSDSREAHSDEAVPIDRAQDRDAPQRDK
jgi:hypothetical protein